jgi:mRNA interferase RelE/StbE
MTYKIVFIPEAADDYKNLDGGMKKLVNKKIERLALNPFLGEQLGRKFKIDLTGFLKIYISNKKYRIIYRLIEPDKVEIVEIWGIGRRDKEEIYRIIGKRLNKK